MIIDRAAVIRAGVVVEVVLHLAAELEQMISLDPGHVISKHLVLSVPDTLARALIIHIVGNKSRRAFEGSGRAGWRYFKRAAKTA